MERHVLKRVDFVAVRNVGCGCFADHSEMAAFGS